MTAYVITAYEMIPYKKTLTDDGPAPGTNRMHGPAQCLLRIKHILFSDVLDVIFLTAIICLPHERDSIWLMRVYSTSIIVLRDV